jgi:hypothetical protein
METKIWTEDNIEMNIREIMKWLTTMSKAGALKAETGWCYSHHI